MIAFRSCQDRPKRPSLFSTLTEDEELFPRTVYRFADVEIRPLVREMDEHGALPRQLIDDLFQLGVMGIEIPDELGGAGATFFHSVLAVEALSRVDPSVGVLVDVQNTLVTNALIRWGTDGIKRPTCPASPRTSRRVRLVGSRLRQRRVCALHAGRSSGRRLHLTGRKLWITNGNEADIFIVFATVNPDAGYRGITAFIVQRGVAGFTVGKKEDKLGIRASSTCELIFEDCRVPVAGVLVSSVRATRSRSKR